MARGQENGEGCVDPLFRRVVGVLQKMADDGRGMVCCNVRKLCC